MEKLFEYQRRAVQSLIRNIQTPSADKIQSLAVLEAPCGSGKSVIAINALRELREPPMRPITYFNTFTIHAARFRDSAIIYVSASAFHTWMDTIAMFWPDARVFTVHDHRTYKQFETLVSAHPTRADKLMCDDYDIIVVRAGKFTDTNQVHYISGIATLTFGHVFRYVVIDEAESCQGSAQPIPIGRVLLGLTSGPFKIPGKFRHEIEGAFISPTINRCIRYPALFDHNNPRGLACIHHIITRDEVSLEVHIPAPAFYHLHVNNGTQRSSNLVRIDAIRHAESNRGDLYEGAPKWPEAINNAPIEAITQSIMEGDKGNDDGITRMITCVLNRQATHNCTSTIRDSVISQLERFRQRTTDGECIICVNAMYNGFVLWSCCGLPICASCSWNILNTTNKCPYCRSITNDEALIVLDQPPFTTFSWSPNPIVDAIYREMHNMGPKRTIDTPMYALGYTDYISREGDVQKSVIFVYDSAIAQMIRNNFDCLYLSGTLDAMYKTLRAFATADHNILVINSSTSCWGIDLSFVDNVFIVYDSSCNSDAFKRQCIGRIQRPGRQFSANIYFVQHYA